MLKDINLSDQEVSHCEVTLVQIRFTWHPQLLINKKTQTSVLGSTRTYAHNDVNNLEASGPLLQSISSGSSKSLDQSSRVSLDDTLSLAPSSTWIDSSELETSNATGQDGVMEITILEARGLRGVDKSGTSDPFVRVRRDRSTEIYKTNHISKTLAPEW
ncbi:hypothetical protein G6F68_014970 [Rhizopus microsporus]|nr:hypothetical protein G6F68_014970 [Rhizopus microsporus]